MQAMKRQYVWRGCASRPAQVLCRRDAVFGRDLLANVGVLETKFIAAVMTDRHGGRSEANNLDLVRMAGLGRMRVITAMHRDKGGSHDWIWTVRTHPSSIGSRF